MATRSRQPDPAFLALYEREFPLAAHTAYLVLGSTAHAQDIAQEALTVAYQRWGEVRELQQPGAWVRRVAINLAISERRRSARRRAQVPPPERHVDEPEVPDDSLAAAIKALPLHQRVAIVLHYFHDLPITDVAESLGCSPSTVKVHLHRGRKNLADQLGGDEGRPW